MMLALALAVANPSATLAPSAHQTIVLAAATPARRRRPARASASPPKPTPTELLATHLTLNRALEGESLAQACNHANFRQIAVALNMNRTWLTSSKGEFESSAEYEDRLAKLEAAVGDPVIICSPMGEPEIASISYDADKLEFHGRLREKATVHHDIKSLGSYRTKTRMGVPATVDSAISFDYDLAITNRGRSEYGDADFGCLKKQFNDFTFIAPLSRNTAAALKQTGQIVFVVKLKHPFVSYRERSGHPTLDDPYDLTISEIAVSGELQRIAMVDATGAEVWTCRPTPPQ